MGLILKQLFSLIQLLNSDTGTNQIAAGIAAGFILGMSPGLSIQFILVFLVILFFRVQLGAALVSMFFFKFVAFIFDPIFHSIGKSILTSNGLKGLFTTMYNAPLIPFTRFNNTVVMGAGVLAIILSPVVFVLAKKLVEKYREQVVERIKNTKAWKALKATSLYKWYYKYNSLYGN
ncbi:MAG: TIGR03546 family protein [Halobacteriovorax sp.]|nr:TIGR03546 family protein [Halobacteriovorax sp.]MEE3080266.1 TIGR03546 family protein [Bdellovibrionota bacterium]|tara:strand:+ start:520 stop:1047 length:528 start_codon:yes stop_codon:yes gene_type:complete